MRSPYNYLRPPPYHLYQEKMDLFRHTVIYLLSNRTERSEQTVWTLIRCHRMWHLIRVTLLATHPAVFRHSKSGHAQSLGEVWQGFKTLQYLE